MAFTTRSETSREKVSLSTEEQLALAIEALAEHVVLFDAEDRVVIANKAWRELNKDVAEFTKPGIRFEDHLRALTENGLVPEASGREEAWLRERMEHHLNPTGPFEVSRQDGRWIRVHEQRLPNDGIILIISDITQAKQAEQSLRESEERYRYLVDLSPDGIMVHVDGKVVFANKAMARILGAASADAIIGRSETDLIRPEDREAMLKRRHQAIVSKVVEVGETTYQRPDGSRVEIERAHAVIPWQGKMAFMARARDITEQKQAALRLRGAIENMRDGFALYDAKDRLVACNEGFRRLRPGMKDYLIPGTPYETFLRAWVKSGNLREAVGREEEFIQQRLEERKQATLTSERQLADGRWFLVKDARTPEGGICQSVTDITATKEAEERLRRSKRLEAIGQVTGGVAHEFNNLLMKIIGNLELLREGDLRGLASAREQVEKILESAFTGKDLTSRLLSYTGNPFDRPEIIDVGEAIVRTSNFLRPLFGETIVIKTEVAQDRWPMKVDPGEFESALTNLAINARDAMPDGGTISIACANVRLDDAFAASRPYAVKTGDYVHVSVGDTGEGMSPDVMERVFDPFFTTKEVGQGTGLGLSMVYGFVKRQSGGYVDIESEESRGTTVSLYFPRQVADNA